MTADRTSITPSISTFNLWLIAVSFVLFQFFLQLSSGVIIGSIMHDMDLSALMAGLLSSSFYFIYTMLQIPVGMLFDRKNTRLLLSINALICSIGCLIFSKSSGLTGLFVGRVLIGAGSAFAFIGLSHILRQYFPTKRFAFMMGLSESLGFTATAVGLVGMGTFISHWGWRSFIFDAAWVGLMIAYLCWRFIPNSIPPHTEPQHKRQFYIILANYHLWINGLFVGLTFSVVTVFGALWAVPFIQIKLGCDMQKASMIAAAFFVGAGLSCPLFGILANSFKSRRQLILSSCFSTASLLMILLYYPTDSTWMVTTLMFLAGICCGAYMLAYSISNELAPLRLQSTATGFTNTLAVLSAPVLQPLVGYFLDTVNTGFYTLANYQKALLVIPVSLIIAGVLGVLLPEKIRSY